MRGSRAEAPKGTKSCRTQGESVHLSVRPSARPLFPPPVPSSRLELPRCLAFLGGGGGDGSGGGYITRARAGERERKRDREANRNWVQLCGGRGPSAMAKAIKRWTGANPIAESFIHLSFKPFDARVSGRNRGGRISGAERVAFSNNIETILLLSVGDMP